MADTVQFKLNLPREVKRWLEEQAKANIRSQGAEVVSILRERMERAEPTTT